MMVDMDKWEPEQDEQRKSESRRDDSSLIRRVCGSPRSNWDQILCSELIPGNQARDD